MQLNGYSLELVVGDGCDACFAVGPTLRRVCSELGLKLNVTGVSKTLPPEWKVERVPAALLCENGQPFARFYGNQPEEIARIWIEAKLEEHQNGGK